jgi:hypothetical protein
MKNALGAYSIISFLGNASGSIDMSNNEPFPNSSLVAAMNKRIAA